MSNVKMGITVLVITLLLLLRIRAPMQGYDDEDFVQHFFFVWLSACELIYNVGSFNKEVAGWHVQCLHYKVQDDHLTRQLFDVILDVDRYIRDFFELFDIT